MIHLSEVRNQHHRADVSDDSYVYTVFHGSELSLIFGPVPNPVENDFANQLTDHWINFVHDTHPGGTNFLLWETLVPYCF